MESKCPRPCHYPLRVWASVPRDGLPAVAINPFPESHLAQLLYTQLWEIHIGPVTEEHDQLLEMKGMPVNECSVWMYAVN